MCRSARIMENHLPTVCSYQNTLGRIWDSLWFGKNTYKQGDLQELNLPNIQTAHTAQYQKQANKQPNQKMGRRPI